MLHTEEEEEDPATAALPHAWCMCMHGTQAPLFKRGMHVPSRTTVLKYWYHAYHSLLSLARCLQAYSRSTTASPITLCDHAFHVASRGYNVQENKTESLSVFFLRVIDGHGTTTCTIKEARRSWYIYI